MRVPTCSARPAPRYAVLHRFNFSARRAPARGVGDFFRKPKQRTSSYTYGTLRCALPRSDPRSCPSVLRVKGRYSVSNSIP
eukprot:1572395-Prymnesium_polylepis.1